MNKHADMRDSLKISRRILDSDERSLNNILYTPIKGNLKGLLVLEEVLLPSRRCSKHPRTVYEMHLIVGRRKKQILYALAGVNNEEDARVAYLQALSRLDAKKADIELSNGFYTFYEKEESGREEYVF